MARTKPNPEDVFLTAAQRRLAPWMVELREIPEWPDVQLPTPFLLYDVFTALGFAPIQVRYFLGAAAWGLIIDANMARWDTAVASCTDGEETEMVEDNRR